MRRVITGVNSAGQAVFTRDDESPNVTSGGGFEMGELWFDPAPVISNGAGDPAAGKALSLPQCGAAMVRYVILPGRFEADKIDHSKHKAASETGRQGDFQTESDNPNMHTTETIDYGFILEGSVVLELDNGVKKTLNAGDCYVQNGTRHAWHNETDQRVVFAVIMLGAKRQK